MDYLSFGSFFWIEENRDSVFYLRVIACSFLNTNVKSNSNSLCLNLNPENFSPNGITTNNNGINNFFDFYGSYPKTIRVKIRTDGDRLIMKATK